LILTDYRLPQVYGSLHFWMSAVFES
jgi:hypothetical protein